MVTENQYVTSLSWNNIADIFSKAYYKLYHPLVTISFAIEYHFFKLDPYIYHITNILLHILNTFFVFFIFLKLTKSYFKSFIISLFFAVYPTNVEVVAWISARKDLLFCFFYLISILCYITNYNNKKIIFYFLSLISFLAACFSKPMAVTLPVIIILIDFFYNQSFSFKKNIKKYIPFFTISILFCLMTLNIYYDDVNKIGLPLFEQILKILNAHYNLLFYIFKAIYPFNLSCMYPAFYSNTMPPLYILYSPAIVYLLFLFVILSLKYNKKIFFGMMLFTVTILPVIGLLKNLSTSDVACRYCYLPYLGLFYIFAEIIYFIYENIKFNKIKYFYLILVSCIFTFFGYSSYKRTILWTNNLNLLNYETALYPDTNYLAYLCRGNFYLDNKNFEQAEKDTLKSYKIFGIEDNIIFQIAKIQEIEGNFDSAKANLLQIRKNNTIYVKAVENIAAIMYYYEERKQDAINMLEDIINTYKYFPVGSEIYFVLGKMYYENKEYERALDNFNKNLETDKLNKESYLFIANIYEELKDFDNEERILTEGLKNIKENNVDLYNLLAKLYCENNNFKKAYDVIEESLKLYPNNVTAYYFLGNIFGLNNNYKSALVNFTMAILLSKDNGAYFYARAAAFMNLNKYELAKKDMEKSLKKGFNIGIADLKKDIEKIKNK